MSATLKHVHYMSKMIQIRHVPDDVHKALKIRATKEGMSLSDFPAARGNQSGGTETLEEMIERIGRRQPGRAR
jgi:hypothetical protein